LTYGYISSSRQQLIALGDATQIVATRDEEDARFRAPWYPGGSMVQHSE